MYPGLKILHLYLVLLTLDKLLTAFNSQCIYPQYCCNYSCHHHIYEPYMQQKNVFWAAVWHPVGLTAQSNDHYSHRIISSFLQLQNHYSFLFCSFFPFCLSPSLPSFLPPICPDSYNLMLIVKIIIYPIVCKYHVYVSFKLKSEVLFMKLFKYTHSNCGSLNQGHFTDTHLKDLLKLALLSSARSSDLPGYPTNGKLLQEPDCSSQTLQWALQSQTTLGEHLLMYF